jgi:hypothetical protein
MVTVMLPRFSGKAAFDILSIRIPPQGVLLKACKRYFIVVSWGQEQGV